MDTPIVDPQTTMSVEALYRSHAAEIFRYAFAMLGNRADAEDVTQATFVNAMRAIDRHGEPHKPSNWLITIAHNVVRQRFRQQQARPTEVQLESELEAAELERGETSIGDLVRALQRIPPNQREALVMRELEGRPYREIAAMLELSLSAVETLIFRARRSLAEELEHLVTCERAELALTHRSDGGMSRKDRRRLEEHLRECPACAELAGRQTTFQDAFKRLALLPAPVSLPFGGGGSGGALATGAGAATVGTGAAAVAGAGSTVAAGGTAALVGGAAAKLAVAAAAIATAGGVGYKVEHAHHAPPASTPATTRTVPQASTPAPRTTREPVTKAARTPKSPPPAVSTTLPSAPQQPAAVETPAKTEQRSGRAVAVQQAHADAQANVSHGSSASPPRSAQGSEHSAAAPGQVKKADPAPGTAAVSTGAAKTPGTPNANANASASKPKGEPAANAAAAAQSKSGPKPKQTADPSPEATTPAEPTPAEPTAAPAATTAPGQSNGEAARGEPGRPGPPRAH